MLKFHMIYDCSLLAVPECETKPELFVWTSANGNKKFWKYRPKFHPKENCISSEFVVDIYIGDPSLLRSDDSVRFMVKVLSPNSQHIWVGSKAGTGTIYIKDLCDSSKNGSPITGTVDLKLRSYPNDVFDLKDGFKKGELHYRINNEDTHTLGKCKFSDCDYMVKPGSNQLLESITILNIQRNMAPFSGDRSLDVDFGPFDAEMEVAHIPYWISDSGVISESWYWVDYTQNRPNTQYYENAFDIILDRKGWTKEKFISVIKKQLGTQGSIIHSEFIDIIDILCDACSLSSISMPYIGDFVFTSPRSSTRYPSEPENVESFQDAALFDGGDCVASYEEIYTEDGIKCIENIKVGDNVLSYDFKSEKYSYKRVMKKWDKGILPMFRVSLNNGTHIDVTENHPMWARYNQYGKSQYRKTPLNEIKMDLKYKKKIPVAKEIIYNAIDVDWLTEDHCFIIGHFFAEGCTADGKHVDTSGYDCITDIIPRLQKHGIPFSQTKNSNGVPIVRFLRSPFKEYIRYLKRNSFDMSLTRELLNLPKNKLRAILDGYFCGDGHNHVTGGKNTEKVYSTSCHEFALQLEEISLKLGNHLYVYKQNHHGGLGNKPIYRLHDNINSECKRSHGYEGIGEAGIKSVEKLGKCHMYDIEIEDTHTFIFKNGILGHNCEDLGNLTYRIFCNLCNTKWESELLNLAAKVGNLFVHFGEAGSVTARYLGEKKMNGLPVIGSDQDKNAEIGYHMFGLMLPLYYVLQLIKFTNKTTGPDLESQLYDDDDQEWKKLLPTLVIEGTGFMEAFMLPICDYFSTSEGEERCKARKRQLKAMNTVLISGSGLSQCQYKLLQTRLSKTKERTRLSPFYRECSHMWTDYFLRKGYNFMKFTWVTEENKRWLYGVNLRDIVERDMKSPPKIGLLITPGFTEDELEASKAILRQQMPLVNIDVQKEIVYSSLGKDYTRVTKECIEEFNKVKPFTEKTNLSETEKLNLYIRPEIFVDLRDFRECIEDEIRCNNQITAAKANIDYITTTISLIRFTIMVIPIKENVFLFQKGNLYSCVYFYLYP